jgi:hypothetical protein
MINAAAFPSSRGGAEAIFLNAYSNAFPPSSASVIFTDSMKRAHWSVGFDFSDLNSAHYLYSSQ